MLLLSKDFENDCEFNKKDEESKEKPQLGLQRKTLGQKSVRPRHHSFNDGKGSNHVQNISNEYFGSINSIIQEVESD